MTSGDIALFALNSSRDFGHRVADALQLPLTLHEEQIFPDGEYKGRPLESVRGCDTFVIQSLHADAHQSVHDKLCRLLFFIGTLRDAGAARITAVLPYLCYSRSDRRTVPRDQLATRYVAQLLETMGADGVLTLDVHNLSAYQNAFRCRSEHLEARHLFSAHLSPLLKDEEVTVVSPDTGGIKRAERLRAALETALRQPVTLAYAEKRRAGEELAGRYLIGEVRNRTAVIVDDMITTGATLLRAISRCREADARAIHVAATHGLFVGEAQTLLADAPFEAIVVTDTVPPPRIEAPALAGRVAVISVAPLVAEAIRRIHYDESLVELTG